MAITLYKLVIGATLTIFFLFSMLPSIATWGSAQFANQLNLTLYSTSNGLQNMVIGNVSKVAFGGCNYPSTQCNISNRTTGFFANTDSSYFTGTAFILNGFGFVMQAILNLPTIIQTMLEVTLGVFNLPLFNIVGDVALLIGLISFVLVIIGISAWMKYNIRNDA